MPKFTVMDPKDVKLGRARAAAEAKQPYREALQASDAGQIELDHAEKPATVKRYLSEAAQEIGVRVRSSWEDPKQRRVLLWKKTTRA